MLHYRPIRFNDFLKEGYTFDQKDGVWHNMYSPYVPDLCILLDMALESGYLELIPDDPVEEPIKIGDKVVCEDYCFVVSSISTNMNVVYGSGTDHWNKDEVRHCTPDEIAKYFR